MYVDIAYLFRENLDHDKERHGVHSHTGYKNDVRNSDKWHPIECMIVFQEVQIECE